MPLVTASDKRGMGPKQPILTGDHAAHPQEYQVGKTREAVSSFLCSLEARGGVSDSGRDHAVGNIAELE